MDPKTGAGYASILYTLKNGEAVNTGKLPVEQLGVAAPDPATCVIALEHPAPYFLAQLTHMTALPVYPPSIAQYGTAFARAGPTRRQRPVRAEELPPQRRARAGDATRGSTTPPGSASTAR